MNEITQRVRYTGVLNPNLRVFDIIMRTDYGTSYNSYVVLGSEKCAVVETAHPDYFVPFMERVEAALDGREPDYLVLNHTEPDHTGSALGLLERYPNLTILCSQPASIYIKGITNRTDLNVQVVKTGDHVSLGDRSLQFISAPFLHWPDSMFTWVPEEKVLFSCDFLGCHYCEPLIFDRYIAYPDKYWDAVDYYYTCIFGPFAPYVRAGLEKLQGLDIDVACTSHGPVLTREGGVLDRVLERYARLSAPVERSQMQIPIFYCTAYGNTGRLAQAVRDGVAGQLPDAHVPLYNIIDHDMDMLAAELNGSDAFFIGVPTINREAVPPVWQLLSHVDGVNIPKRPVAVFGSYGWSGEAVPHVAERLASMKAAVFEDQLKVCFVPSEEDLVRARQLGRDFAKTCLGENASISARE